jgi:hypothetical protein
MERDAAPAVVGLVSRSTGGEGSPSGPHYEGSAFNGWTGARRAGRKSCAKGWGMPLRLVAGSTVPGAKNRRGGAPRGERPFTGTRRPDRSAASRVAGVSECAARRSTPLAIREGYMTALARAFNNEIGRSPANRQTDSGFVPTCPQRANRQKGRDACASRPSSRRSRGRWTARQRYSAACSIPGAGCSLRSKRSSSITLVQAAAKSRTNFSLASLQP